MTRSYSQGISSTPLLGETIGENLARAAARFPDREALVVRSQGVRLTYRELEEEVRRVARGLMARGIAKGDRVGIWAPNRVEWVLTQYATATMGAILVNINPAYKTAELEHALRQSGVSVLLAARAFRTSDFAGMIEEVRGRCPALREVILLETGWQPLLADAARVTEEELRAREATLEPDDAINVQYTSGTTGFPKGATLTHHNILNNGFFVGEGQRLTEADRVCIPVPFYHCFGMVLGNLACTTHGATMVIPGEAFDPLAVLETVTAERCTALYGVPTMFIAILEHPRFGEFSFPTLRTGIMAGSPCPVEVMKKVQTRLHMPEVTICYGMTETSPVSTQTAVDDPLDKRIATVGRVHPHLEVKIVEPATGRVVPRGETGELCTRGYSVMLGYWNDPESTPPVDRRRALDAHRRPRHHGRGRLRQHRRPHQGHDHPRRGERLSARGGGVPVRPPGGERRGGDRRAERALRRGGHGLGPPEAGRRLQRRGPGRVLPREDRDLQDPAPLEVRRGLPGHGHREDPEVQDAGDVGGGARAAGRGQAPHRLAGIRDVPGRSSPARQ